MRPLHAALAAFFIVGLAGGAGAQTTGEKPSTMAPYDIGVSALSPYDGVPKSHLSAGAPAGGLSASGGAPGFALSGLNSELRAETGALLTALNATEQDDGSILVALPGDVLFDFDKSDIRADAEPVLAQLIKVLINYDSPEVEISGHTDAKGSDDYNQALSERRAVSVSTYLSDHGVDEDNLVTIGKGEAEPVAPNEKADGSDDPEGRQKNRRVEFVITPPPAED